MWQGVVFLLQSLIFSKEKQIDALMVLADRTTELLNIFAKEKDMWKDAKIPIAFPRKQFVVDLILDKKYYFLYI